MASPVTDSEKIVKVTGSPYSNRERRNKGDPVSGVDPPVPSPPGSGGLSGTGSGRGQGGSTAGVDIVASFRSEL